MPKKLISVDPKKLPWEQETPVHNRWHPDIPPVASVDENEVFRVECVDWTGGQIQNNDNWILDVNTFGTVVGISPDQ